MLGENKVKIAVEIEMTERQRETIEISKNTDVLGGKINRLDWEGDVFDEVDMYRELLYFVCSDLMNVVIENFEDKRFIHDLQMAITEAVTPIINGKLVMLDILGDDENE